MLASYLLVDQVYAVAVTRWPDTDDPVSAPERADPVHDRGRAAAVDDVAGDDARRRRHRPGRARQPAARLRRPARVPRAARAGHRPPAGGGCGARRWGRCGPGRRVGAGDASIIVGAFAGIAGGVLAELALERSNAGERRPGPRSFWPVSGRSPCGRRSSPPPTGSCVVPPWAQRLLRQIPPAALASIVLPALLRPEGELDLTHPRFLAGILAALVAWKTKNVTATLAVGMGLVVVLQRL